MKKTKFLVMALMIGTMSLAGVSFAEAGIKLDDIQIGIRLRDEHQPPAPERREAPRPPEEYRHGYRGQHDAPPPPMPAYSQST